MQKWFIILLISASLKGFAQDSTVQILKSEAIRVIPVTIPDSLRKTRWVKGGLLNLNVAQGSLKDWAAGGDDFTITINMYANGHAFYKKGKVTWDNNVDINLGYLNTTSLGTRKNDDRLDLISKYGYALNKNVSLSALFNLRTQFFDGFTYNGDGTKTFVSTSFAPAYVLLSPGFDIHPVKDLSIFLSPITSRWVVVVNPTLSKIGSYGVPAGAKSINELGAFVTLMYHKQFNKFITYNGRLDLFSNYRHNPQDVDVYLTNLFAAKLGRVLTATWSFDMIYDDDARKFGPNHNSPRLQIRSLVGVGILWKVGI